MIRCQTRSGWGKTLMKLLLDTHTFLWADMDPDRLSAQVRSLLANPENERLLSSASLWEIQIKSHARQIDASRFFAGFRPRGRIAPLDFDIADPAARHF